MDPVGKILCQMVLRLSSSNGIGVVVSVSTMPSMSPVSRLISCGAQFWSWMVQWLFPSKVTQMEGPDIGGCFGTPMSAISFCSLSIIWNDLACTRVVVKGGKVKLLVAKMAFDGVGRN